MKRMLIAILMLFPVVSFAVVPDWTILPAESSIRFVGAQNNAPVKGEFKKFTGKIHFDPEQLNDSLVSIKVDMNSVSTSYKDFTITLLNNEWFNVSVFPTAEFIANEFIKKADGQYEAKGKLTIRDKTLPLTIGFEAKQMPNELVRVTGHTTLKRLEFGIGQGEWQSTSEVADEVDVYFDIVAKKVSG